MSSFAYVMETRGSGFAIQPYAVTSAGALNATGSAAVVDKQGVAYMRARRDRLFFLVSEAGTSYLSVFQIEQDGTLTVALKERELKGRFTWMDATETSHKGHYSVYLAGEGVACYGYTEPDDLAYVMTAMAPDEDGGVTEIQLDYNKFLLYAILDNRSCGMASFRSVRGDVLVPVDKLRPNPDVGVDRILTVDQTGKLVYAKRQDGQGLDCFKVEDGVFTPNDNLQLRMPGPVSSMVISPNGKFLYVAMREIYGYLIDTASGALRTMTQIGGKDFLVMSADGQSLFSWSFQTAEVLRYEIEPNGPLRLTTTSNLKNKDIRGLVLAELP
jgi:6-phosphogluconolactonase (cycloisomerase 2 family)